MAKKPLKRIANELWHCINGEKILGPCSDLSGDCSGLSGNCSEIPAGDRPSQLEDWVAD
jgi:hypothetical protein